MTRDERVSKVDAVASKLAEERKEGEITLDMIYKTILYFHSGYLKKREARVQSPRWWVRPPEPSLYVLPPFIEVSGVLRSSLTQKSQTKIIPLFPQLRSRPHSKVVLTYRPPFE